MIFFNTALPWMRRRWEGGAAFACCVCLVSIQKWDVVFSYTSTLVW